MSLIIEYVRQFGRFQRNARLYLINNALSGMTSGILLVLYNLYLASLGYKADFIGVELFAATVGAGLAIVPAGMCIDRFSGKVILIAANLLIGLASIGQFLFRQPLPLLVSAFIAGVGFAFILVINAPFLTANSTPSQRSHLFSLNIALGLVTIVVGNVLGGALPVWLSHIGWLMGSMPAALNGILASQAAPRSYQLSLLLAGVIVLPSLVPLFLLSNDPAPGSARQARAAGAGIAEARAGLRRVLASSSSWGAAARIPRSPIFLLSLQQALIGAGAGLFINYFNIYFVQHLGASSALFGLLSGATVAITALFTLAAPGLAARIGRVNTISLTVLASLPFLLTLGLTTVLPLAAACYVLRQGLMDMSNGVLQVFSMEVVPPRRRGLANSSYQAAFQVPNALAAPLGGLLIVRFGYAPIFLAAAACYLLAIAVLWGSFGRRGEGSGEKLLESQ
jgi:MFS family permease